MKSEIELQKNVQEELQWESILNAIKPAEIGVTVRDQVVTLSGTVDNYTVKLVAEKAAMRVAGVKAVANEIKVKLPSTYQRDDTDPAHSLLNVLQWSSLIPEDKIQLKVEDGWVTFEGEVGWPFQKHAVTAAAEPIQGVKGVTNLIKINPVIATPDDIRDKLLASFKRNSYFDGKDVKVDVKDRTAILKGQVNSLPQKTAAENAAWSAPGISRVDNELKIINS